MPDLPKLDMIFVDHMSEHSIKERLQYNTDMVQHVSATLNHFILERSRLMDAACKSSFHKGWARPQDDMEQLFKEQMNKPGVARSIMPVRRIPWSEQEG